MAPTQDALQPAIDALEADIADLERQWNALVSAINVLRAKAGQPPRGPSGPGHDEGPRAATDAQGPMPSRSDQFYNKRMGSAAREYLEMRHAQGLGPAKPREIFEALKAGGYQFGGKDETNQMVVLRTMMRKSTQMFHKLPNGTWGLKAWYGNIKPTKGTAKDQPLGSQDSEATVDTSKDSVHAETADADEASAA